MLRFIIVRPSLAGFEMQLTTFAKTPLAYFIGLIID